MKGRNGHQEEPKKMGDWDVTEKLTCSVPSYSLLTNWRFTRGVKEQTRAFLDGFNEVVPLEWLRYFDEKELEVRRADPGGLQRRPPRSFCRNRTVMTSNLRNAFSWPETIS